MSLEHKNEKPQNLEQVSTPSSTIAEILDGRAKIKFASTNLEEREGRVGRASCYDLEVAHLTRPGETWNTELLVWHPMVDHETDRYRVVRPETQIDILTGQGWMRLSSSKETLDKIFAAIQRQTAKKPETQTK